MPLIHLGQAAWNMVPDQVDGLARTQQATAGSDKQPQVSSGASFSRNQTSTFARRVENEIRSATGSGLIAGSASAGLLVLLAAEPQGAANRRQRAEHVRGAKHGSEFIRFTRSRSLERLVSAAAPNARLRFLICAKVADSMPDPAHNGYAAALLAAGMLANAIVSAALESGWPASVNFAPEYDVTEAARQVDRLATHIGTVYAHRQRRS